MNTTTIEVNDAVRLTTLWREENHHHSEFTRAFKIPLDDIKALAQIADENIEIIGYRAYLGVDDTQISSGRSMKLVFVAITKDGNIERDIILDGDKSAIYDFTTPCPSTCDHTSVLFKGYNK